MNSHQEVITSTKVEQHLCLSCGMCCDGTFLDHAFFEKDENPADFSAVDHYQFDGTDQFKLPCPALKDKCCSIHGNRPQICGKFKCPLLNMYRNNYVSREKADSIIHEAERLRNRLLADFDELVCFLEPMAVHMKFHLLFKDTSTNETYYPRGKKSHAFTFLAFASLSRLGNRYFKNLTPTETTEPQPLTSVTQNQANQI